MTKKNGEDQLPVSKELEAFGYISGQARRGIVTNTIALLCLIILILLGVIIWQQRVYREDNVKQQDTINKAHELQQQFLMELLQEQAKTKQFVDTSYHIP